AGNNIQYQKLLDFQYTEPTTEILKARNPVTGVVSHLFDASGRITLNNGTTDFFRLEPSGKFTLANQNNNFFELEPSGQFTLSNGSNAFFKMESDGKMTL